MHTTSNRTAKYALWLTSLLIAACAGGPPDTQPEPLNAEEQIIQAPEAAASVNSTCANGGVCPAGETCAADGTCHPIHACHHNRDCPKGQICDPATGRCSPRPPHHHGCHSDADCPNGGACDATTHTCGVPHCTPNPDGTCK